MTFTSWQFGLFVTLVLGAYYLPSLRSFQVQLRRCKSVLLWLRPARIAAASGGRSAGDFSVSGAGLAKSAALAAGPLRLAVALYENWMHGPVSYSRISIDSLLRQPPSDFDNHVYVDRAVSQLDADDPSVEAYSNVDRVRQMIPELEDRGTRVLLFELPYAGRIEQTRSVKITHAIAHAAFPEANRWLPIDVARDELRWADGVHLDERSAAITVESIEQALRTLNFAG